MVELQSTRCHKRQNSPSSTVNDGSRSFRENDFPGISVGKACKVQSQRSNELATNDKQQVTNNQDSLFDLSSSVMVNINSHRRRKQKPSWASPPWDPKQFQCKSFDKTHSQFLCLVTQTQSRTICNHSAKMCRTWSCEARHARKT